MSLAEYIFINDPEKGIKTPSLLYYHKISMKKLIFSARSRRLAGWVWVGMEINDNFSRTKSSIQFINHRDILKLVFLHAYTTVFTQFKGQNIGFTGLPATRYFPTPKHSLKNECCTHFSQKDIFTDLKVLKLAKSLHLT